MSAAVIPSALQELLHSSAFWYNLVQQIPDLLFVTETDGRIVYINYTVPGLTPEAVIGTFVYQYVPESAHPILKEAIAYVLRTGNMTEYEIIGPPGQAEHSYSWYHTRVAAIKQQHNIVGLVFISNDISANKQASVALASRIVVMDKVISTLSHELNQPLASIVHYVGGCLEKLNKTNVPTEIIQVMEKVMAQAERAGKIVQHLKYSLHKEETQKSLTAINDLINQTLLWLSCEIQDYQINVNLVLDQQLPLIKVDRIQIEQVLVNIVYNAVEALSKKANLPRLVTIASTKINANMLQITIANNGPEIASDVRARIFEPFYTTKPGGTGMGLSICRANIEAHGGTLTLCCDKYGDWSEGAVFVVTLPLGDESKNG